MSTWVLLRGLMRETRHWSDFPRQFRNVIGAETVVTLDFPGNGRLHALTSPSSVAEMANHCRMQLGQQGHAPPYRVLALSLGAMAAVEWSARHPAEIDRLVLINTSLAPHNSFYQRLRPVNYPALLRFLVSGSIPGREALILHLTSTLVRNETRKAELLEQWVSYARECPVTRSNFLRQLWAAISYEAPRAKPPVRVLFLAGQQDRLVDVECSKTLAEKWDCPIRLHPAAGHDLPLDDASWVAQQVNEWLHSSGRISRR